MKIVFKVIKAGSGNDVYFERLSEALRQRHIETHIEYYHKNFQYAPWLLKFVNKHTDADIIHTNAEYGWVFKEKNKPLIVSVLHNVFDKEYKEYTTFFQRIYYSFILKGNIKKSLHTANIILAISNYTKRSFERDYNIRGIKVLYCCLDTTKYKPHFSNKKKNKFEILYVGNFLKRKGVDILPKVMDTLGSDYILYFTSGLRTNIPQALQKPNMIPLGKLTEDKLIHAYNSSDVLFFPTRLEGFGYAAAEAMACGKPVVSTQSSSIPEIVKDGENGFLCPIDNIDCFVESIKKIKEGKKQYELPNRKKIKKLFSYDAIAKNYEELII